MTEFEEYFYARGYKLNTVRIHRNNLNHFNRWCEVNNVNPKTATLNELYDYQDANRTKGEGAGTLSSRRKTLEFYYHFTKRKINPALLVRLEKRERTLPKNMLSEEHLLNIYMSMDVKTLTKKRDKVMLGLALFQGLKRADIDLLEIQHIDFEKNRILVPATHRSNKRYIPIKTFQKQELQQYVYELHPQLLKEAKKDTSKLFFSMGSGEKINNVLSMMVSDIKFNNPYFISFQQVAQSRISIWVKEFGLRETQYLSGMKYPTSVERYVTKNTDSLKNKLTFVHPMDRLGM